MWNISAWKKSLSLVWMAYGWLANAPALLLLHPMELDVLLRAEFQVLLVGRAPHERLHVVLPHVGRLLAVGLDVLRARGHDGERVWQKAVASLPNGFSFVYLVALSMVEGERERRRWSHGQCGVCV